MKKKIFTQIFATLIMLVAIVMNCYAQDVRYLVVEDLDGKELDAFYTDNIQIPKPVGNIVNIENTWDGKAKLYPYPMETTRFRFDTRAYGNATSTEVIATEKWYVTYNNGTLYVKGSTNAPISIYTITGIFVGRYQNTSEVNVYLNPGFYLVHNGKQTAKLSVNGNGTGSASAEVQAQTKSATYAVNDPPITLRSGTVSTYSGDDAPYYWNIGGNFSVDVSAVSYFQFLNNDTIKISYGNGNSVPVVYNGSTFTNEPSIESSYWDLEKTLLYGGGSYWSNHMLVSEPNQNFICVTAVHVQGVTTYLFPNKYLNGEILFPNSVFTYEGFWALNGRLTVVRDLYNNVKLCKVMADRVMANWLEYVSCDSSTGMDDYSCPASNYDFNAGVVSRPTVIEINSNGDMYMEFESMGKTYSYTFMVPK